MYLYSVRNIEKGKLSFNVNVFSNVITIKIYLSCTWGRFLKENLFYDKGQSVRPYMTVSSFR